MPIVQNRPFCQILYLLAAGEANAASLGAKLGKTHAITYRQIDVLFRQGYLRQARKKRGAYQVGWKKVLADFFALLKHKKRMLLKRGNAVKWDEDKTFETMLRQQYEKDWQYLYLLDRHNPNNPNPLLKQEMLNNKYLRNFLKAVFSTLSELSAEHTIEEVFETIIDNHNLLYQPYRAFTTQLKQALLNQSSRNEADKALEYTRLKQQNLYANKDLRNYLDLVKHLKIISHRVKLFAAFSEGTAVVEAQIQQDSIREIQKYLQKAGINT